MSTCRKKLTKIISGDKIFESSGYSLIKITRDGKEQFIDIPIRTAGIAEYQEQLRGEAPKPPIKKELIKKSSKEGVELGLSQDKLMQVFDTTDEKYIDDMEEHSQNFLWRIILHSMDIDFEKEDGTTANSFKEKKAILQASGITGAHTDQIFKDVQNLTHIADKEEDFLSGN